MVVKYEQWAGKAVELFGENKQDWKFQCPSCGLALSINDARERFPELKGKGWSPESECIGRYTDRVDCNWCAYGLFSGPLFVECEGKEVAAFDFEGAPFTGRVIDVEHSSECRGDCDGSFICESCNKRHGKCRKATGFESKICASCSEKATSLKAFYVDIEGLPIFPPDIVGSETASKARFFIAKQLEDAWNCGMKDALRSVRIRRMKEWDTKAHNLGITGYLRRSPI